MGPFPPSSSSGGGGGGDLSRSVIRRECVGIRFGMYTDDDVRRRSVCEITSPQAFDPLGTPLPGGLYDPSLGPTDTSSTSCPTCGNVYINCPGHSGHIELCVPVYHPLTFGRMVTLLRIKCMCCHGFRLPARTLRAYEAKFHLLDCGRALEASGLDDELSGAAGSERERYRLSGSAGGEEGGMTDRQRRDADARRSAEAVDRVLDRKMALPSPPPGAVVQTSHERRMRRDLTKEFLSACASAKKCGGCGAVSPKIRQDSSNKIFVAALSMKDRRNNIAERVRIRPACAADARSGAGSGGGAGSDESDIEEEEEDDDDVDDAADDDGGDDDGEGAGEDDADLLGYRRREAAVSPHKRGVATPSSTDGKSSPSRPDRFVHALEVEAQVRLTWEAHPFLCERVFGSAHARADDDDDAGGDTGAGGGGGVTGRPRGGGGGGGWSIFFQRCVAVPPARFRPPMTVGAITVEHSQNFYLSKVLQLNDKVRTLFALVKSLDEGAGEGNGNGNGNGNGDGVDAARVRRDRESAQARSISGWIDLQTTVNCYVDSSKDPSAAASQNVPNGIRQLLEKKEGIFRKNMMGKRVNFACRSVISPDPYIGANEIGVPLHFARTLTYPTPVIGRNAEEMRGLVERGPGRYPGASWVEFPDGRRVELGRMSEERRRATAARLLAAEGLVTVGRQMRDGDVVLVNRQPTLHKPGIMGHRVRVLYDKSQTTLRMHYANCNTYNADFDGDEMNCHFPQNDIGRAEAELIASTDLQYTVPTDGSPLRGLIQDHVDAGVKLTGRDTFLERWQFQQLLFAALVSLPGLEVIDPDVDIETPPPAVMRPRELWTGKQVITALLRHLRRSPDRYSARPEPGGEGEDGTRDPTTLLPGVSCDRRAKTPPSAFGDAAEEHLVLVRDGELLRGVLDKAAFGATDFSLVHAVHEAYGPEKAGTFLNALGRLFTSYLQQYAGHSCRMEDLVLTPEADEERRRIVQRTYNVGARAAKAWADSDGGKVEIPPAAASDSPDADRPLRPVEAATAAAKIGELLSGREGGANFTALDGYMQGQINPLASEIIKACLPNGLAVPFPKNTFSLMTTTGAKGSTVNQSQVSCALGQQALEGRRVPRMSSGRTLPSFAPYDPNPRADGFIADRFLTGVRPQEYYFHCMAGREGLVDTAVKTSRSGYLQRCLVKHLEELKVCYDSTVRDGEGGVIQFLYGEDGVDPTRAAHLDCSSTTLQFMARNHDALRRRYAAQPDCTIDAAGKDFHRYRALDRGSAHLMRKGGFVRARRLRFGSEWRRGSLCRGWFDAVITKRHSGGRRFDLMYTGDKSTARNVPLEVEFAYAGSRTMEAASRVCALIKPSVPDPILSDLLRDGGKHRLGSSGACVSERVAGATLAAVAKNPRVRAAVDASGISGDDLGRLVAAKYSSSLCAPGEAVGCIAAQSVGEPSTQMTLNTFHLAGCAGANVTLGIPRLREIIMTASRELKTPTMSAPLLASVSDREAMRLTRFLTRLTVMEVIDSRGGIVVTEALERGGAGSWVRAYHVRLRLHSEERIEEAFGLRPEDVAEVVAGKLIPNIARLMRLELRRSSAEGDVASAAVQGGESTSFVYDKKESAKAKKRAKDDDEDDDEDVGEEDGVMGSRFGHRKEMASYGDMDDEEKAIEKASRKEDQMEELIQDNSELPANVTDDEEDHDDVGWDGMNSVKIDRKTNTLVLRPLSVDPSARPLLMVGLVERAANSTLVRSRPRINEAFISDEEGRGRCLQTAGVNFEEFWKLNQVDHNQLASNHTWAVRCAYGVEAARMNIVEQIRSVFGVYGIEVDPRHLTLIADYMTFDGSYRPMNRTGMADVSSSFLQMSFETTANFMVDAALHNRDEPIMSPSANIVLGRPVRHGTGSFECFVKA